MKLWRTILAGWITFVVGHAILVAIRARLLVAYFGSGLPRPISDTTFRAIDGVILFTALALIVAGTFVLLNKPRWKLFLALIAIAIQLCIAYLVYMFVTFTVHMGVGGPL